jgi:spore germination protein YaaH
MKSWEFLSEAVSSSNIYTVKSGDSLQSITQAFDTTVDGILWQNPQFASPGDIVVGSRMRVPGSGAGVSAGGGASGNAKIALDFFRQQGWTSEQAAGLVANLQAESGQNIDPAASNPGEQAYGIAQWRGTRQQLFAKTIGKPLQGSSLQDQLQFVQWELNNTESRAGQALKNAQSAADAAAIIDQYYERSSGAARQKRMAQATQLVPTTA